MKIRHRLLTPSFSLISWLCSVGGPALLAAMVACSDDSSSDPGGEKGGIAGTSNVGGNAGTGGTVAAGAPGAGASGTAGTNGGNGGAATGGSAGSTAGTGGSGGATAGGSGGTTAGGSAGFAGTGGSAGVAGTGGSAGSGGGVPAGCTAIQLKSVFYDAQNSSELATILRAPLSTSLGNAQTIDGMSISIISPDGAVLTETGTFVLGQGDESNYSTCTHCIVVDQDAGSATSRKFFPTSGTMTIDPSTPPISVSTKGFKGKLEGVELHEVTIGPAPDFLSTPVPGGGCLYVVDQPLNVTP